MPEGGPVVQERFGPGGTVEIRVLSSSSGYLIVAPTLGSFEVDRGGARIVVTPSVGARADALEELLSESILPLIYQLTGEPSLHASSVRIGDVAVGFVGRSHAGKSTMAAVMAARSARLLGDDCLRVAWRGERFVVLPYSTGVRLRGDAARTFGGARSRLTWDGRTLVGLDPSDRPVRLSGLFLLAESTEAPSIERLGRRDATAELACHLHRLDPHDPALLAREFEFLERLVDTVLVARLAYPRTFEAAAEAAALVQALIAAPAATGGPVPPSMP